MSMASVEESFPRGGSQKKPKTTDARKRPVDRDNLFHTEEEEDDSTKKRRKIKGDPEQSDQFKPKKTEGTETSSAKSEKQIEILKFKSLTPGLLLLGCVKDATDFELIISLPHGLTGFVQVTNICEAYTKLLSEQVETEEISPNLAPLQALFTPGMLVRCAVSSLEETKGGFHSMKLSLNPKDVNKALSPGTLKPGMILSGCVSSVEDHGYLIDIGVGGSKAFLPRQKAQSYIKQSKKIAGSELKIGQYLNCLIDEVKDAGRIVRLSVNYSDIMGALATEEQQWTQNNLLPGLVVKGKVQKVFPDGIKISFLSNLTGTVDFIHLDPKRCAGYQEEQMVKACILYVDPTAKAIGLSLRQLFLQPGNPLKQLSSERIGEVVNQCLVMTFHDHSGAIFDLGDGNLAFAHIHNIPSQALSHNTFKKGIKRTGRIVDYSPMDEMALMSLITSVIQTPYFSYQDIHPGQLVEGTVASLRDCGIIVQITRHMTGLVPILHLADVRIKQPEKKYSKGQLVKCRVLTIVPAEKKLILTLKKTLVDSTLPIISSFHDAKPGMTTTGFISRVKDFGCLVQFYNDVRGLVPRTELSTEPVPNPEEVFYEGQVVKVMVLSTDPNKERIKLSFKLTMGPFSQPTELSPLEMERALKCKTGKVFDVKVLKKSETGLAVSILQEDVTAFLPMIHLSDYISNCKLFWNTLQEGDIIPRVACLNNASGQITFCRKHSLISAFEDGSTVKEFSDIQSGMMLTGWVKSILSYGVFVEFPHGLFGLVPKSAMCDKFVTNTEDHFVLGQTVVAKVTNTDEEKKRVLLSLKLSECSSDDIASESFALLDQYFQELLVLRNVLSLRGDSTGTKRSQSLAKLLLGQKLKLTVQDVNNDGSVRFSGGEATDGITVLASPFHVEDVSLVPGQKATAVVLSIDVLQSRIHVSLRPELLKTKAKKLQINDTVSSVVQHVAEEFAVVALVETGQLAAIPIASHYNDTYRFDSEKLTVGQTVRVMIKTLTTGDHGVLLAVQGPVASRTNKKLLKKSNVFKEAFSTVKHSLSFGDVVTGTVKSVKPTNVLVTIADKLVGSIHASQIFDETPLGTFPTSKLKVKQRLTAKVIGGRDVKTHRFLPISHPHFTQSIPELSIRRSVFKSDFSTLASTEDHLVDRLKSYKPGQSVTCFVWKYNIINKCLDVEISSEIRGRIDHMLLSINPKILKHPEKHFKLGQSLSATVISADTTKMRLQLSLTGAHSLAKGVIVLGTVRKVDARTGLTIALPFGKFGIASLVDLNDSYSEAPLDNYSSGKAVRCCVLSINDHRIHVSLRQSRLNPKVHGKVEDGEITCIDDIKEGQLLRGYVTSVCDQGVFVSLSATIAGRVQFRHASKFFVGQHSVFEKHVPLGRLLTVKVLSVDSSNEHIELSLLPNDTGKPDVIPESLDLPLQALKENQKKKALSLRKLKEKRKGRHSESEPGNVSKKKKSRSSKEESDSGIEVYFREEEDEEPVERNPKAKKQPLDAAPRLQTSSSFTWDVNLNTLKVAQEQKGEKESSDSDEDEDQQAKTKKKSKKDKETEKKQAEKELSKIEATLMDSTRQPQTADDFDRLVLSSPNSSILWLQYMAFHLHATEIEKARAIAERALKTISFREEQEKLNVWVAFLNLENMYGTEDLLMKVFERAVQYNEPLKVFMQLGDIYAKSEKFKQADGLYNSMLKRFRKEKCVWVKYATYLLKQGQMEEAHRLLQRALKCLPDNEHVDVISKFAQLEFHLGDVERAKSIFESTLSNYPKRTDIWSVYIDMMIKHGSQKEVRNIFERVIHLSLAAKRMKFFFKRYLDYEKKHGSQESVQAVKEKALEYVESKRSLSES